MAEHHYFLSIPAKKTFDVNLSKPIRAFVRATYGNDDEHSASIDALNQLRTDALLHSNDKIDVSTLLR
jgi:aminopeptidase-like protein